ncbi:YdcF family protein [Actinoalloteichus hymeniacidonis]|uniref:DUF218 domain-containing protein n=1 Tax=Actinoalloteichus hymeniacidonis TaxID=340345 RepID=A0AAC9HNF0_9PSEU|nr:YdcF family protein [Actinoalloteichus hymeniacidonis]AOS61956.1 hypothetical protein TL08_05655 [Actinoalloteichus hymeniacidonis]MBB5910022.1 uncharacterized SAM-binding protein YcdF (DUF218 family) [Actinoalloteichus hymeniacidonis]
MSSRDREPAGAIEEITAQQWRAAELIWDYHQLGHELRTCDAAIALGSHDLGVATVTVELYAAGWFPLVVFSGGNSRTTRQRFPRGEAVHYREHAIELGMPATAILIEQQAANTGENITLSRALLAAQDIRPRRVLLICKPYAQRRAFATCARVWPAVDIVCVSEPLGFADYVLSIGDAKLVVDMLVGDLQRVIDYPELGFMVPQDVPAAVRTAYDQLVAAGFDSRLVS